MLFRSRGNTSGCRPSSHRCVNSQYFAFNRKHFAMFSRTQTAMLLVDIFLPRAFPSENMCGSPAVSAPEERTPFPKNCFIPAAAIHSTSWIAGANQKEDRFPRACGAAVWRPAAKRRFLAARREICGSGGSHVKAQTSWQKSY